VQVLPAREKTKKDLKKITLFLPCSKHLNRNPMDIKSEENQTIQGVERNDSK